MIKQKRREKIGKGLRNNYHIWSSGRLLSLILIAISFMFFVLSIVQVPFLSAIPGYTFGFLFGYYSFIVYLFIIYYALCKLFNINIYLIKMISKIRVFNYSWLNVYILTFGIILIIETSIYMINNNSPFPGVDAWTNNFDAWWKSFTSFNDAIKPNIGNAGVIINFLLSILYSIGGTIVSIIFSLLLISYFVFYLFFSSPLKNFENKKEKKKMIEKENKEYETKIVDLSFEDEHKIVVSDFGTKILEDIDEVELKPSTTKTRKLKGEKKVIVEKQKEKTETIPFDNPFEEKENFIATEKITEEIKVKKKKPNRFEDTEFIFNNEEKTEPHNDKKNSKIQTPSIYNQTKEIKIDHKEKSDKPEKRKRDKKRG